MPFLHGVDEESILGDNEVWSSQARWTVRKGHNFRSDRWIAIKLLQEFPDALFHGVGQESILGDDEVGSSQAKWTGRKGHNFRSDCWIALKLLLEFSDALFHGWMRNRYSVIMRSGRAR